MKLNIAIIFTLLSFQSFGQSLQYFNGDYGLTSGGNCNSTAKVEISDMSVTIQNGDRENRGWGSVDLKIGVKRTTLAGYETIKAVSIKNNDVIDETFVSRSGERTSYTRDTYTFFEKNGRKSLTIAIAAQTSGNVSGQAANCSYEKK